jgi:hypothetical protein
MFNLKFEFESLPPKIDLLFTLEKKRQIVLTAIDNFCMLSYTHMYLSKSKWLKVTKKIDMKPWLILGCVKSCEKGFVLSQMMKYGLVCFQNGLVANSFSSVTNFLDMKSPHLCHMAAF